MLIGPLLATMLAGLVLLADQAEPIPPIIITPEVIEILAHRTLRLYCLLGALGGGFIAVMLTATGGPREMAGKWTVGVISGLVFTPWLLRITNIPPSTDYIVAAAAAVSLLAWGCLHKLLPVLERLVVGRARRILGDKSDPSAPTSR